MLVENAMVLAAGLGTRLRPLTDRMPKPLVPVGGRPMIDYVLDALSEAGIRTVCVNVHHHADQMEAHLAERADMDILISDERAQLMNNGGGLAKGLKLLPPGLVMVMNADLFWVGETQGTPTNLQRLIAEFDPSRMDMLMLCARPERVVCHAGKMDFRLHTDGRLTRYQADDPDPVVYSGAFVMHTDFFADAPETAFNLNLYFDKAIARQRLYGIELSGHWLTVGSPEELEQAEAFLAGRSGQA
jgi:MurNAc alpha-1-phosphate uridylyltransferase